MATYPQYRKNKEYIPGMEDTGYYYIDNFRDYGDVIPTLPGLANVLGVSTFIINRWAQEEFQDFDDVLDRLMDKQHLTIINIGLRNQISPKLAQLMMGYHGYVQKRHVESDTNMVIEIKEFGGDD